MELTDVQLIQNTLNGDQDAFSELVRRYQNRVHALAWRKTEDFHVAEEITQDTFLRAYRNLGSLKNPQLFAGWLYVIANRLCKTWFSKKAHEMQSLETVPTVELEQHAYSDYTAKQRDERASDIRVELVKRLLQKLPESERIVTTLHYLAGSSVKEISGFLGVSMNTVKSRLHRARKRLQKEENMLQETLGSFQPSTALTNSIISKIKQTEVQIDTPTSKPFIPIVSAASTLVLVLLMLGLGSQHLARFQKPYSLDATSKMSVEIVDASVMMNLPSDPNVRNQIGNVDAQNKSDGKDQNVDAKLPSSNSGRVIDEAGNPISGLKIALTPVRNVNGGWFPIIPSDENGDPIDESLYQAETNIEGHFTVTNPLGFTVKLTLFPIHRNGLQMKKIQIAGMYFYPSVMIGKGVVFETYPDAHHEDIQVILKQPQIRVKVLHSDGTAITNTTIRCDIEIESPDGYSTSESTDGFSTSELTADTDDNGYFVYYMDESRNDNRTYSCKITAKYEEQKASVGPFELRPKLGTHNVVLIMGEEQVFTAKLQNDINTNSPSQISTSNQNDHPSHSIVPQQTSMLSGKVIDIEGKPVADLPIYIRSVKPSEIEWANTTFFQQYYFKSQHSRTKNEGTFTIKNISSGAIYLGLLTDKINTFLPDGLANKNSEDLEHKDKDKLRAMGFFDLKKADFEPCYEVLSIRKQGVTFYSQRNSNPIVFGINPGTQSKNVVVTVKPRMRVRGRLLSDDGTPVANTRISLRESRYTEDGKGFGSTGGKPKTDENGYFIYYPREEHDPMHYIFGLRYKGMVAESEPILLKPGERYDELKLQLESIP